MSTEGRVMASEVWKPVIGYENVYEVSNMGKVRRVGKAMLTPQKQKSGYLAVNLSKNGKPKVCLVHRLVALAFVDNPNGLNVVNHLDENKENNEASNLEWTTLVDNFNYGTSRKRSIANMKKYWENHCNPRKMMIRCIETNKVFCGVNATSAELGISAGNLSECLNGKRKTAGGYHWEFIE